MRYPIHLCEYLLFSSSSSSSTLLLSLRLSFTKPLCLFVSLSVVSPSVLLFSLAITTFLCLFCCSLGVASESPGHGQTPGQSSSRNPWHFQLHSLRSLLGKQKFGIALPEGCHLCLSVRHSPVQDWILTDLTADSAPGVSTEVSDFSVVRVRKRSNPLTLCFGGSRHSLCKVVRARSLQPALLPRPAASLEKMI